MEKQRVECKFSLDNWIVVNCFYTCTIKNKIISQDVELEITGEHKDRNSNRDVEAISFWNCTISKVPQRLTRIFPNLKILQITNSKLKSITHRDLLEYKDLIFISLPANRIHHLPGDLFSEMKNLQGIWLKDCKIKAIEPNFLDGLERLKIVNLKRNSCIDKCFDSVGSNGCATLQEIKDEIREKFSWKKIFDERNELEKMNAELRSAIMTANNKNKQLEEKNAELRNAVMTGDYRNKDLEDSIATHNNGICGDVKKLIQNEKLKNFTVQVDDEEFKVHKFLLAARSPVLNEMIENNMDAECLKLVDISKEIFREILNFIYTDELPESDDINYILLYSAAGRLKIENLKKFAAEKLIEKFKIENNVKK